MDKAGSCRCAAYFSGDGKKAISPVVQAWMRAFVIVLLLIFVVFIRHYYEAFNISLRYLYMIIITLSSFWFGLKGGFIVATMSIGIFFSEIIIFQEYDYRSLVLKGTIIRIIAYYACGIIVGMLSDKNRIFKDRLNEMAYFDELTGCSNYRFIIELFKREILQCERTGNNLIVAMIDLDNFKSINDNYGHQAGNLILRRFASILHHNIRKVDIIGRFGGDEFIIIFPDCNREQVAVVFSRIKKALRRESVSGSQAVAQLFRTLQFSAGVISYHGEGKTVDELIEAADLNLYKAKAKGKKTVVFEGARLAV